MRSFKRREFYLPMWPAALALMAVMALIAACGPQILGRPTVEAEPSSWYIDIERFNDGAHGGTDCSLCHVDITPEDIPDQHPSVDNLPLDAVELFDYAACGTCHPEEYEHYQQGLHAEVLRGERESKIEYAAPTCGHCHDPHYGRAALSRLQIVDAQVRICGQCHPSELKTYLDNYHGKTAVDLDYENSASCADCHGSHRVLSLSEPEEAIRVCRECHPDASENMAGFLIHAEETISPEVDGADGGRYILLFFVQVFFILLTVGVLAFFYGHTFLWLLRNLHEKLRRR